MFCFKCGKEIDANTKFCPFCGQNQEEASASEAFTDNTPKNRPGTLHIIYEGKQLGLIGKGYFIYVDDVKYYTGDYPNEIIVAAAPGAHRIFASSTMVSTEQVKDFGKKASKMGRLIGGRTAYLGGNILELSTKISAGILGDSGTCSYNVNVNNGETVKIKVVLKKGIPAPIITIQEIERN